jgi:hypothetical protein
MRAHLKHSPLQSHCKACDEAREQKQRGAGDANEIETSCLCCAPHPLENGQKCEYAGSIDGEEQEVCFDEGVGHNIPKVSMAAISVRRNKGDNG